MMLESMLWLNTPTFVARFLEDTVLPAIGAPKPPLACGNIAIRHAVLPSRALPGSRCQ